jgi:hypothetical protein
MKPLLICCFMLLCATEATAQACWIEVEYLGEQVVQRGQCHQNVSDRDFERQHCRANSDGETLRSANTCPNEVKLREGASVATRPIVATCLSFRPGMAVGVHNIYYYKDQSFGENRSSLQSYCQGHGGQWAESK